MDCAWLDHNVEASRLLGAMLHRLRAAVRRRLHEVHGDAWPRAGIPAAVMARLVDRKELEKQVDWYESEYQELTDFASFTDLVEILIHNPSALPGVLRLAPRSELVAARFAELEVMRLKVATARPVGEADLAFLSGVQLRLDRALGVTSDQPASEELGRVPAEVPSPPAPASPPPLPVAAPAAAAREEAEPAPPVVAEAALVAPAPEPAPEVGETQPISVIAPQSRPSPQTKPPRDWGTHAIAVVGDGEAEVPEPVAAPSQLAAALAGDDSETILRCLHRDVTAIAEALWAGQEPAAVEVWAEVVHSPWFARSRESLHLQPLSRYFAFVARVVEQMRAGLPLAERETILKSPDFARHLLDLRAMFQRNGV